MDNALEIGLSLLCFLVAIPLLMQVWPGIVYRRWINAQGDPVEPGWVDHGPLKEEIVFVRGLNPAVPKGRGWQRGRSHRTLRNWVGFCLGVALVLGAVCLLLESAWLTPVAAAALFALGAIYGAWNLPSLVRRLRAKRGYHWIDALPAAISALAVATGVSMD
ncbi:MAG: hypothetical protein AAF495_06740 [Pseudomonadota bacterium]